MGTLEQQLKEIDEKRDKAYVNKVKKDFIEKYAVEHFGDEFKIDKTRSISDIRKDVCEEIDKRLGNTVDKKSDPPKLSPELERKEILFQKFNDDNEKTLPPYDEVFNEDGTPKFVLCVSNNTVWEPSPGMLGSLGKEFEPCDKDGVIRRLRDYDRHK